MMTEKKSYAGIDYFRLIAALLIVAIHTSPLVSFSQNGNFMFTRIIARVAVPFFFITSGFFLISRYTYNAERLYAFIKKTALIYGIAILIYIPINIYNEYFKIDNLLPNIIKDLVFDGTLYHLWYLPASIIGAVIAWFLIKKTNYPIAFLITFTLYIIGLFGDSYYGIAENISCLNYFYNLIFQVSDYTRNGIFFAPIFFVFGGYIFDNQNRPSLKKSITGFIVCFALMFGEAFILHYSNLQRHDSMYIFLLPSVYFLFNTLLYIKGKSHKKLRRISLIIYIIHPFMIVMVRLFARLVHMQDLLIENSLIHYITVCFISVVFAMFMTALWRKLKPEQTKHSVTTERAYLEIDLNNLEHNVSVLKKAMPKDCELMAVVKAEAYGHGTYEIATHINKIGVKAFAVATIDEGIKLRKYGITGEILILGYTAPERAKELCKYNLMQALIDYEYSIRLNNQGYKVNTHIKIDTGMHRLGFDKEDVESIAAVFSLKNIKVCGIFTHLCASDSIDEKDVSFTNMQIECFYKLLKLLKEKGIAIPKIHIQSSYGFLNYPELKCNYVRAGVALYGVLSSPNDKIKLQLDLRPVLSLKARVILLRQIKTGDCVGYSRSFVADRDSRIAILSIGYADGYPRILSCGKSYVLINGHQAPIVGKICMDLLAVDVTDCPDVTVGSIATLIGKDGNEEILAPTIADISESITNELLSRMGRRLKIIHKN